MMNNELTLISNPEEIKQVLLGLLIRFDEICRTNDINYSLAYGTLIGAVRHKGFIPWDDDVDVYIPRDDYYKLLKVLNENTETRYKLVSIETDEKYDSVIPKFVDTNTLLIQKRAGSQFDLKGKEKYQLGLYIDVFVLDKLPCNKDRAEEIVKRVQFLQKLWGFSFFTPYNEKATLINKLRMLANKTDMAHFVSHVINRYSKNAFTGDVYNLGSVMYGGMKGLNDLCSIDDFIGSYEMSFEGHNMKVLKKYDEMLTKWYGDYMTPPPKDQQVSNHSYKAYWLRK